MSNDLDDILKELNRRINASPRAVILQVTMCSLGIDHMVRDCGEPAKIAVMHAAIEMMRALRPKVAVAEERQLEANNPIETEVVVTVPENLNPSA